MTQEIQDISLEEVSQIFENVRSEIRKKVIGQDELVMKSLVALFSGGHVLLEWVPGLAKTLFSETLATVTGGSYSRIQFTPDLLPSDVIGSEIYRPQTGEFIVKPGPIVADFVLADEINRAPSKVQSALLEAMQERKLSIASETILLPKNFFVIATMNPIDQEGTYELPEASLDRFFFQVRVGYPTREEEMEIALKISSSSPEEVRALVSPKILLGIRKTIENGVFVDEKIYSYAVDLIRSTRDTSGLKELDAYKNLQEIILFGASPRATIALIKAAKTIAACSGRDFVIPDDIKSVAFEVLRHRIRLSYSASASGITTDSLIADILKTVRIP